MPTLFWFALLAAPWWDDQPTTVQSGDPATAGRYAASSVLCGLADDPAWGIIGARIRQLSFIDREPELRALGVPLLCWVETFGTTQSYVARLRPKPGGGWLGFDADPATARPDLNHWAWQLYEPVEGEAVVWVGLPAYYNDAEWARPWTRTHPRYGAPPLRYPDGRVAEGFGIDGREDTARVWDAGGSKDILGGLNLTLDANAKVPADSPAAAMLIPFVERGEPRRASLVGVGKDAACPHWLQYVAATARYLVDQGVRGVWADNFSAWDNLGNPPVRIAFGDWSVARFREHLAALPAARLAALEIGDPAVFDIRAYLRAALRERFGGDDANLADPLWRDVRWRDDPVWREFLIFKQAVGREALLGFHEAFHGAAREAGIADFGIQGNDIPGFCFGLPRPAALEMVSTEFSPGWSLFGGPRGVGLPPGGRLAPLVRMAQCHARGRTVHLWYYLEEHQGYDRYRGNEAVGRTIAYELLTSGGMLQAYPGAAQVAGTEATHRQVNEFVAACRAAWGDRRPLATVGLVYSPDSDLVDFTPGGFADLSRREHLHDLLGWATALSQLGVPYEMVPEWDLTADRLARYRVLVLPTVKVLREGLAGELLEPWVRAGGRLHLTGDTGLRGDESTGWTRATSPAGRHADVCRLARLDPAAPLQSEGTSAFRPLGRGAVRFTPELEGLAYYAIDPAERTPEHLVNFRAWVRGAAILDQPLPGFEVGYWASPTAPRVFIEIADVRLDPERTTPVEAVLETIKLDLPGAPTDEVTATVRSPGGAPRPLAVRVRGGAVSIEELRFVSYASIQLDGWSVKESR